MHMWPPEAEPSQRHLAELDTLFGECSAAAPDAAIAFVNFLADPAHAKNWKRAGFEPANVK